MINKYLPCSSKNENNGFGNLVDINEKYNYWIKQTTQYPCFQFNQMFTDIKKFKLQKKNPFYLLIFGNKKHLSKHNSNQRTQKTFICNKISQFTNNKQFKKSLSYNKKKRNFFNQTILTNQIPQKLQNKNINNNVLNVNSLINDDTHKIKATQSQNQTKFKKIIKGKYFFKNKINSPILFSHKKNIKEFKSSCKESFLKKRNQEMNKTSFTIRNIDNVNIIGWGYQQESEQFKDFTANL